MNLAILITSITNRAGTERAVSNLANILCDSNHKVYIISISTKSGECPYELNKNVSIQHMGCDYTEKSIKNKLLAYYNLTNKLKKFCKENKIDVVFGTLAIHSIFMSSIKNVKKIACEHFNYESAGKIHNLLKRIFYPKMDAVVLLTERDKKNYKFLRNVHVIQNSLSFESEQISNCLNKEIISVGRLNCQKGFDLLIQVVNQVKDKIPDWHFTIYGEGEEKENLEKMIMTMGLSENVSIHPNVSDIENVYINSSIYVSCSRWEGLPMVLIESQSFGIPAIAFDCPNGPDEIIVDNVTGCLVDCFNVSEFAKKILLLTNDNEKRILFGKKAKELSTRFSTVSIGNKWINLLNSIN